MNISQKSQKALEYNEILTELSGYAKTEQSKRLCLELTPASKKEIIERELKYTQEAKRILDFISDIPVGNIISFSGLMKKNEYFVEEELVNVAKSMQTARITRNFLKENLLEEDSLAELADAIYTDKDFEDRILNTFDDNYTVKREASPELSGLYSSLRDTENILKEKINGLMNSAEFQSHLQENIYTKRDDRIVFQVKASDKSKVPGIVHDVSATNKTFYIEPSAIVPINNKIRELKSKIYAEVIRILTALSKEIKDRITQLKEMENLIALIDFHFAKARYAIKTQAVQPYISEKKYIKIDLMRHPLLIDRTERLVENDFSIGEEYKSVIITGSNTGGKTVALKTVGLFVLMTESGMFLPCAEAHIYPFEKVLADIGDEQSILQNLSTFSAHMKNIIDILRAANSDSIVLIDELCAGTDPQEGAILAEVILKELNNKGALSVITTHYGELKTLEFDNSDFKNACVEFDSETLSPTYKLVIGIPGLSNAISISAALGLDKDLIWKAKELLITQRDPSSLAVERLQDTQKRLDYNLKEAEELNNQAEMLKAQYEKELSQQKKEKKKALKALKDKFYFKLESAKTEIKDILEELRQERSEKVARRSYNRLANLEKKLREDFSSTEEKETYKEIDWNSVSINDTVMIKELNQAVKVLSIPDKNDTLYILMGMIKTKIKKDKLAQYDAEAVKKVTLPNFPKESFTLNKYNISNTLDLRGERVEEALDSLEAYLDKASLANLSPVYIIHGHGTGALKSAVREFVSTSPYVAKFRTGEDAEGGDGVCVIDIR